MTHRGVENLAFHSYEAYALPRKSVFIPAALRSPEDHLTSDEKVYEKHAIMKNLVYLYLSILLISSPMYSLINSASSLLADSGVGVLSLAVLGATQVVAAALLGSYTTKVWGVKLIITISFLLIIIYTLSFYYPSLPTAMVGAAMMGLGYTLIFTATFLYANILGMWYACVASCDLDTVLVLMLGAVNSAFGGGIFLGNILYFYTLYPISSEDASANETEGNFELCASGYCNEDLSHLNTMHAPEAWRYYTLLGVYTAMGLGGTVFSLFVQDFSSKLGCARRKKSEFREIVVDPWLLLKDARGYLLIVITTFIGLEQAFLFSEFTEAFISCVIGIRQVGMVMLILGFSQFLVSALVWLVERHVGRIVLVFITTAILIGCFITLLIWRPQPDQALIFYVISFLWGVADAILLSVVLAVYGLLFEDNIEGSFALGNFWFSLGYLLSFGWGPFLCITVKLYILIAFAFIGTVCYIGLEILNRKTGSLTLSSTFSAKLTMDLPLAVPVHFKRVSVTRTTAYSPR